MELDELKHELNVKLTGASGQRSATEIASLLKHDALSVVQKLKRSLVAELVVSILFLCLCCYMIFFNDYWIYFMFFTTFSIIGLAFTLVLYVLLKKTNSLTTDGNVKHNLEQLVAVLDEYVRRYLQLTLILLPICFVFGVWLSYNDDEQVLMPLAWDRIIYLFLAMMILAAGVFYFTKWYLEQLYGTYLAQLKDLLKEISAEEAA